MEIDRQKLKDSMQRPLTQGLFLEVGYNTKYAVYTLKDEDCEYKGKTYPSLKRLYLEMEDPGEYEFATKYLANWNAWERILDNNLFRERIEGWRRELAMKLRSKGIKSMMEKAETSPMAAKWLADNGWEKDSTETLTKKQKKEEAKEKKANDSYSADIARLKDFK